MTPQEAYSLLGASPQSSVQELEAAHAAARAKIEREIAAAPTAPLKDRYQKKLKDLDAALGAAKSAAAANLPKTGMGGIPPAPEPRPVASTPAPIDDERRAPRVQDHPVSRKAIPWKVVGVAVSALLVIGLIAFMLSNSGPKTGRDQGAKTVEVDALVKEAADKLAAGDESGALAIYRKILESRPDHPTALSQVNELAKNRGRVRVETSIEGATAYVLRPDAQPGSFGGKTTPAEFADLPFGRYKVLVTIPGYAPVAPSFVDLRSMETQVVGIDLERQTGSLVVSADAESVSFTATLIKPATGKEEAPFRKKGSAGGLDEDDKPRKAELKDLPTGTYSVELTELGQKREIEVTPGGRIEVAFSGGVAGVLPSTGTQPTTVTPAGGSGSGDAGQQLSVRTERADYRNGDAVVCLVDIPFDGHLRLYSIDVNGARVQIFPNDWEQNDRVRKGARLRVPGTSEYTLDLQLPAGSTGGTESVMAVLSPEPFKDGTTPDSSNPFPSVEAGVDLKSRGLSAKAAGNAARGSASYKVSN